MLQSIGLSEKQILWDSSKIIKLKSDHKEMNDDIIKQVPQILENPIIVMKSKTRTDSITMYGEVYSKHNKPILAILLLTPNKRNGMLLDAFKISNAYEKNNSQNLINSSEILYIDKNKKRVDNWEKRTGLQLPVGSSLFNSNTTIPQKDNGVNNHSMQNKENNSLNGKHSLKFNAKDVTVSTENELCELLNNPNLSFRGTSSDTPMSEWGHAMFSDNAGRAYFPDTIDELSSSNKNAYFVDKRMLTDFDNIENIIVKQWNKDKNDGVLQGYEFNNYEINISKDELIDGFNPNDIVDDAGAYDSNKWLCWFVDRIADTNGIVGVNTTNGAIVFDEKVINKIIVQKSIKDVPRSLKVDSNGNKLSEKQIEYFKDSKVRNLNPTEDNDIRFSVKSIDEFDAKSYNEVKVSKQEYAMLYHEAMTWDSDKPNRVLHRISGGYLYYYTLNNGEMRILDKQEAVNIHDKKEISNVDRKTEDISSKLEIFERRLGNNRSSIASIENRPTDRRNDRNVSGEVSAKRRSDGAGYAENGNNADLREEKIIDEIVKLQLREDGKTNRDILSDAMLDIANTDSEKDEIKQYASVTDSPIRYSKEVDFSYKTLTSKEDMSITEIDDSKTYTPNKESRKYIIDQSIENARKGNKVNGNGNVVVYVDDIDTDIIISKNAIRHSLDRRLNISAPIDLKIADILKNAIKVNELTPKISTIEKSYALIGIAKNPHNEPYIVSFVVNRATNSVTSIDVLYAVNTKTEPAGSLSPEFTDKSVPLTGSTISISNLLDYVNRFYPDLLSEDVLRHFGYEGRPDGVLGESALYSKEVDDIDYNSVLKENKKLKELNDTLKQELLPGHHTSTTQIINIARKVKKLGNSNIDTAVLGKQLKELFDYIGNSEDVNSEDVFGKAIAVAKNVLDNAKETELDKYAQTVLQDIHSYHIKLSDEQKAEGKEI